MEWRIQEQGPRVVVEVWREDDGAGLYKAYAVGPTGRCLLGTLIPENGRLFLRRTLTADSLKRQGVWPVTGVEVVLTHAFQDPAPVVRWEDPVLRRAAEHLPRHTVQRAGEGVSLSFPFDPRTPFPLIPAFCFARVESGRLIFFFRANGMPYISSETGKDRGEVNG